MKTFLVALAASAATAAALFVGPLHAGTQAHARSSAYVTLRLGDHAVVPAAAVSCRVEHGELGATVLSCQHTPKARVSVVFYKSSVTVWGNDPDNPLWSGRP